MLQNLLKLDLCEIIDLKSHDLNIWSIYRLSSVKFQNFDLEAFSGKKHNKGDSEFFFYESQNAHEFSLQCFNNKWSPDYRTKKNFSPSSLSKRSYDHREHLNSYSIVSN